MRYLEKISIWLNLHSINLPSKGEGPLPPGRFLARVISVNGDQALMFAQGTTFTARLEAFVAAGETLLLEQKGRLEDTGYFRIVARTASPGRSESGEISGELIFTLIREDYSGSDSAYPLFLYRYPESGRQPDPATGGLLFDLYLETEHLGLVLLRLYRQGAGYGCRILVQDEKAGAALEEEARRILAGQDKQSGTPEAALLEWTVHDVSKAFALALDQSRMRLSLSTRV